MSSFLIINPFGIGDVLFTTPVVRAIRQNFPDAVIGYWCNQRVEPILRNNPHINHIFALSRGDLKKIYAGSIWEGMTRSKELFFGLRAKRFDICLDFSLDHRYSLVAKFAGIKRRIGFNYKKRGRFLTDKIEIQDYNSKHSVEYYLDLLKFIDTAHKGNKLELYISDTAATKAKRMLSFYGLSQKDLVIGVAPGAGASWGKDATLKHWPAIRFAQLLDKIIDDFGAKAFILGDESERPIADVIINTMKNKPIDLVGRTTLEELAAIIGDLDILITNDGGPLHMAVALGKKTVSFFGPVDPRVYGPYPADEKRHIVLQKILECSPCYRNFRLSVCGRDRQCLDEIGVDEAFAAVARLIKG